MSDQPSTSTDPPSSPTTAGSGAPADAGHHGERPRWTRPSPWWNIVYLGVLWFQPAFAPGTTWIDWAIVAVLTVIAVGLLVFTYRRTDGDPVPETIAFAALGVVGVWFNGGASVFFVYAAATSGGLAPRERAQRWLFGLTATLIVLILLSPIPLLYRAASFAFPLAFVWIVGRQVIADHEREREAARLRIDNARIERLATLGERERIARDLHDLLGHTLTGILVRAQLIERLAGADPDRAVAEAGEIERMARGALGEVRSTVSGWRHHALDAELDAARATLAAVGVTLTVEQPPGLSLSPAVEAALALAVREAVTNVVRHARARTCRITLVADGGLVRLTVADDGTGKTGPDGGGVTGMRDRISALGGEVEHHVDQGTVLTVTAPAQEATG